MVAADKDQFIVALVYEVTANEITVTANVKKQKQSSGSKSGGL